MSSKEPMSPVTRKIILGMILTLYPLCWIAIASAGWLILGSWPPKEETSAAMRQLLARLGREEEQKVASRKTENLDEWWEQIATFEGRNADATSSRPILETSLAPARQAARRLRPGISR